MSMITLAQEMLSQQNIGIVCSYRRNVEDEVIDESEEHILNIDP